MKRTLLATLALLTISIPCFAGSSVPSGAYLTLQSVVGYDPGTDNYRISSIKFDNKNSEVTYILEGGTSGNWNGHETIIVYTGAAADNIITTMNTKNFSINSLRKQTLNMLIADGKISGTVTD